MGKIFLYTGEGGGKTTNALGAALRTLGHNKKVVVVQFLKWWKNTGEYLFKHPNYKIIQVCEHKWQSRDEVNIDTDGISVAAGLIRTWGILYGKNPPDLLILDEINLVVKMGLTSPTVIKELLKNIPEQTTVFLTGREAPQELIDLADYAIEIKPIKIPEKYDNIEGINY